MPSIISATTTNGVAVQGDNSGSLQLQTNNGTTAVTIDTSQNVGIGTTSPTDSAGFGKALDVQGSSGAAIYVGASGERAVFGYTTTELQIRNPSASGTIRFYNNNTTERMRITSDGHLTIGESSSDFRLNVVGSASTKGFRVRSGGNGGVGILDVADTNGNSGMLLQANGDFIIASSYAQKASGTTWANPSDVRIKENIADYTKGLNELANINVKTWDYNGKAGTVAGTKGLGVIADEIMQVLPETVDTYKAKLNKDDAEESDIKRFDATEITWLLVNAVKELKAELDATKAEVQALKGVA